MIEEPYVCNEKIGAPKRYTAINWPSSCCNFLLNCTRNKQINVRKFKGLKHFSATSNIQYAVALSEPILRNFVENFAMQILFQN